MNDLISIISGPKFFRMDKTIHTTVFTLKNVSFIVEDGFTLYDNGKAAKEGMGFIEHCNLFPYMTISEVIEELMELAKRSNMTFDQLIEWLGKNNREENLPWEE